MVISGEGSGGLGGFGAEPGQVQQGSEEGSGEGLGGFGAKPGHAGVELDLALHQGLLSLTWLHRDLLRNLLRNPVEPDLLILI